MTERERKYKREREKMAGANINNIKCHENDNDRV